MVDAYNGTIIGADGRRYANDDEDVPTTPPANRGFVTRGESLETTTKLGDLVATLTRSVTDAVLNGTTGVTSAAANWTSLDVGAAVSGDGMPANAKIVTVTDEHTIVLNVAATLSGSGKHLTFVRDLAVVTAAAESAATDVATVAGDLTTVTGRVTAAELVTGGVVTALTRTVTDAVFTSSTAVTSAAADFTSSDVGAAVSGAGVPAATTIASVTNQGAVVLSAATTTTGTGKTITIVRTLAKSVAGHETRIATLENA